MTSDGFMGRWSRRKLAQDKPPVPVAQGPAAPLVSAALPASPTAVVTGPLAALDGAAIASPAQPGAAPSQAQAKAQASLPTLQDIPALTPESDFRPYLSQGVEPQVRNAAMTKLFTDPRYNVMDGLDTYIDDYSKPDPIPESMLRKMVSAQFLGLFDEKKDETDDPANEPAKDDAAELVPTQVTAQQGMAGDGPAAAQDPASMETQSRHADPDLRLQPNHATAAQEPGRGAG